MFYLSLLKLCFEISVTISNDPFSKLALCMCYIVIYHKIMSPSMDHKCHNITYMLCKLSCTLSNGWWRSIIKWSNVCGTLQAKVAHFFGIFCKVYSIQMSQTHCKIINLTITFYGLRFPTWIRIFIEGWNVIHRHQSHSNGLWKWAYRLCYGLCINIQMHFLLWFHFYRDTIYDTWWKKYIWVEKITEKKNLTNK